MIDWNIVIMGMLITWASLSIGFLIGNLYAKHNYESKKIDTLKEIDYMLKMKVPEDLNMKATKLYRLFIDSGYDPEKYGI